MNLLKFYELKIQKDSMLRKARGPQPDPRVSERCLCPANGVSFQQGAGTHVANGKDFSIFWFGKNSVAATCIFGKE